jgi:hypothetical protein
MHAYTTLNEKHNCRIFVLVLLGDSESVDTINELIQYELDENPKLKTGYIESYPFFKADFKVL